MHIVNNTDKQNRQIITRGATEKFALKDGVTQHPASSWGGIRGCNIWAGIVERPGDIIEPISASRPKHIPGFLALQSHDWLIEAYVKMRPDSGMLSIVAIVRHELVNSVLPSHHPSSHHPKSSLCTCNIRIRFPEF